MKDFNIKCENSQYINFLPYIGDNYYNSNRKILVLGESHYGLQQNNKDRTLTLQVVRDEYLEDRKKGIKNNWTKCYRNVAAMITGEGFNNSDYIWKEMSFYNFFQEVVGVNAKDKQYITDELIQKSQNAFWEILDILKPDIVIAWGLGQLRTKWLPKDKKSRIKYDNLFTYEKFPNIPIWCISHPSTGFSYNKHHEHWKDVSQTLGFNNN